MDCQQFGSQVTLISQDPYKVTVSTECGSSSSSRNNSKPQNSKSECGKDIRITLRVCYDTVVSILLISIITIATIYINHLQNHVQRVDNRAEDLAARVITLENLIDSLDINSIINTENDDKQSEQYRRKREVSHENNILFRSREHSREVVKRSIREIDPNESEHERSEHHGIGASNIAYISADIEKINRELQLSNTGFTRRHHPRSECVRLYEKDDGQHLCTASPSRPYDLYMTSRANHRFPYMTKAPWMRSNNKFEYHENGELTVHESGIYIVHSNIHFTDKSDEPDYGVYYKRNRTRTVRESGDNSEGTELERVLISKCQVSATDKEGSGVFPCPTWQLIPLKAKDRIYMRISGYNWFKIEKETFHLALIRLNDWPGL